jgi:nitrite transporter
MFGNHPDTMTLAGLAYNTPWVTLGNFIGGAVFVAGTYFVAAHKERPAPVMTGNDCDIGAARAAAGDRVAR